MSKCIAIVRLSALGDIIFATAVLPFIRQHFPSAKIDWFCDSKWTSILENTPFIDTVIPLDIKKKLIFSHSPQILQTFSQKNNYDFVIDLQGRFQSALASRLLSSQNSWGLSYHSLYSEKWASFFYRHRCFIPYDTHIIHRGLSLVSQALNIPYPLLSPSDYTLEAPLLGHPTDLPEHLSFLNSNHKQFILIIPGTSQPSKNCPLSFWIQLIRFFKGSPYSIFLSSGSPKETQFAQQISLQTQAHVLPSLSLSELKKVVSMSRLVIGGDSGPTHLAWALKIPSITIFLTTPIQRILPISPINKGISPSFFIDSYKKSPLPSSPPFICPQSTHKIALSLLTSSSS